MLPHLAAIREFSDLLITEAKLAARLDHANVVQVHDLGRADGFLYIAMQYVEGFDLAELLRRCAKTKIPLPIQYGLLVVIEVLKALDYAHRREDDDGGCLGIVHRDVSPSNVLISFEGEVKICDFGIAHANDVVDLAPDDAIRGKAGYMSPEHANGMPVDGRADVFALGIVLWELLAGRRLYRAVDGGSTLLDQARAASIPELPVRGLADERVLHSIVRKALRADRDERYPNARAMLDALDDYIGTARLVASPLRFGEWLIDYFGEDIIHQRRARERAIRALETGPVAVVEAVPSEASSERSHVSRRRGPIAALPDLAPESIELPDFGRRHARGQTALVLAAMVGLILLLAYYLLKDG
jgi:eukaryotic-like serine/threonine-protein kinase